MGARTIIIAAVLALSPVAAGAQSAAKPRSDAPRVELGATYGGFTNFQVGETGPGLTLGVAFTPRTSLDLVADALMLGSEGPRGGASVFRLNGVYLVQVRRTLAGAAAAGPHISWAAGFGGGYYFQRVPEMRIARPDGSTLVYPRHTDAELARPSFLSGGIVVQRPLTSWVAVRGDLMGIVVAVVREHGFVMRATIGLMTPIGGKYTTPRP